MEATVWFSVQEMRCFPVSTSFHILTITCSFLIRFEFYCGVHTLRDPSGYPSGGSPLIGTVSPGPNWPFLSPP